jgi:GTP-binding protein HflX
MLADRVRNHCYRIPQSRGDLSAILHKEAKVLQTEYEGNDMLITAIVPNIIAGRLADFIYD